MDKIKICATRQTAMELQEIASMLNRQQEIKISIEVLQEEKDKHDLYNIIVSANSIKAFYLFGYASASIMKRATQM